MQDMWMPDKEEGHEEDREEEGRQEEGGEEKEVAARCFSRRRTARRTRPLSSSESAHRTPRASRLVNAAKRPFMPGAVRRKGKIVA